jgi:hypothetical protein
MAIEIKSFRRFDKNTLKGFLTVRMTNIGLEIRDICLHEKNGKRWVQMPSKPYESNGETKWSYINDWYDREKGEQFNRAVIEALDKFRSNQ